MGRGVSMIGITESNIRFATAPFDGGEHMKIAVYRCRKKGANIIFNRKYCCYYNVDFVDDFWIKKYDLAKEIQDYKIKKLIKIIDKC